MRRLLALCCAVVFLDTTFFAALAPLLPDLKHDLDLTTTQAGLLSGCYAAGALLFALPGGWFAARSGPRRAVLLGLVGIGVFSPIFGFAKVLWLLYLSRFLQGASGALLWAGAMSWVVTVGSLERRGALVGTLIAAATTGELLGAPLGGLADVIGTEIVFGAVAVVAAVLFVFTFTNSSVPPARPQPIAQALASARGSSIPAAMWIFAAASLSFGVVTVVAPLHIDELGGSGPLIAAAFACGSIFETILGPTVGRWSDRVGRSIPYRAGATTAAIALLGLALGASKGMLFASVVLFAVAAGLCFTPASALLADTASTAGVDQGYASGLANAAWGGGQMLGAFGAGALVSAGYIWSAIATLLLLGSAAALTGRIAAARPAAAIRAATAD